MGLSQKNEYTDAINTRRTKCKAKEMPLEHKPILTIREASFYTGISEKKLIEITNLYACPFVLWMGNRRFIKRKAFEKFIQTSEFKGGADDEQIE